MIVSGVNASNSVGGVSSVGRVEEVSGDSFDISAGQVGEAGAQGTTTVDLDWGGMDFEQFQNVAEQAGMDPNSPQIEAAFANAAGDDVLSPQESMDNFGQAVQADDGRNVTLDNAAFQRVVSKLAEGDLAQAASAEPAKGSGAKDASEACPDPSQMQAAEAAKEAARTPPQNEAEKAIG